MERDYYESSAWTSAALQALLVTEGTLEEVHHRPVLVLLPGTLPLVG
jgi:hypothetical protein